MKRSDDQAIPTHKEDEKEGLVEAADYETGRLPPIDHDKAKGPWVESDVEKQHTDRGNEPQVHVDNRLEDVLKDADLERQRELKELREKARAEEQKEVEELLSRPQPGVPAGWDYLVLPRKINLLRVKTPPTIMQDDYFKPVKALVIYLPI